MSGFSESTAAAPPQVSFWRRLVVLLGLPGLGALGAYVLLATWIIPHTRLGGVERIRQLGLHLDNAFASGNTAAFLGDSVTLEGMIDMPSVDRAM